MTAERMRRSTSTDLASSPVRSTAPTPPPPPPLNLTTANTKMASPLNGVHDHDSRQIYVQSTPASSGSTGQTTRSTHNGEASGQQNSSSSSSSAADVDVHQAWDNYDLLLPVNRRRSDDRCSLLSHWTNSTASLKSCISHNAESRLTADNTSTAAKSDGGAYRRQTGSGHRQQRYRDRCRGHRLDTTSNSKRSADGSVCSRHSKNRSRGCEFAGSLLQQRVDHGARRRPVSQSSLSLRDADRCRSARSTRTARRRRATARVDFRHAPITVNINDDDFITTSSESEDQPSASTSSFPPANCIEDRDSLLSCSTTSSSGHRSLRQPTEPSLKGSSCHVFPSPRCRTSTGCARSLITSNNIDDNDNLNRSKSSEEITEVLAGQSREDDLRAARSLFEFRSTDELRVASNFIDGLWSLYSRRTLYNERYVCLRPEPPTSTTPSSVLQFYYTLSEKDFRSNGGCDHDEIVADDDDDRKSNFNDVTGSEQLPVRTRRNNHDAINDDDDYRHLNFANIVVQCDSEGAFEDGNSWRKEIRPLEVIEELVDVTATIINEDNLEIYFRKAPKTFNDTADSTPGQNTEVADSEPRVPLPKLLEAACEKHLENTSALHAQSRRQDEKDTISEKLPALSRLIVDLLANGRGAETLPETKDCNSRFAGELIHIFDALLVRSGVRETASVDVDIKTFQPLSAGVKDCATNKHSDASKCLQVDPNSVTTTTGDDLESLSRILLSGKPAGINRSRHRKKREAESEILPRLTPRLVVKPRLAYDLEPTKATDPTSCNAEYANVELHSPKQATGHENGKTSTNSTQTNEYSDERQATAETRQRISRRSRGRGRVRELVRLFESASASTLSSSASPIDVKRATISAAVSVGELLRRASEQQVTSCRQNACVLPDSHAKQPKVSSSKSTEALSSSADFAQVTHPSGDECPKTAVAEVVVHKSTARWPTMSRIRRKHVRRRVDTASVGDSAASPINLDRLSEIPNSRSDARTASAINNSENLSGLDMSKTSKAIPLRSEDATLRNDVSSECQDPSTIHSANCSLGTKRLEAHTCYVSDVANTSNLLTSSTIVVADLPAVVASTSFLSPAAGQENVCQLPSSSSSSSSSSQRPAKSLHTCEVAATANTFTPSVAGCSDVCDSHDEGVPASSEVNKCHAAHFNDYVHWPTNCSAHGRASVGYRRKQLLTAVSPEIAAVTTEESKETPTPQATTTDNCQRFSAQSWSLSGGPRLEEVPSENNEVAIIHRRKSFKATLGSETDCPAAYPVVRLTGVTVHLLNKVDVVNTHIREGTETGGDECIVDKSSRGEKRPSTQSTTKQADAHEAQAVKHKNSLTVTELMRGGEQLYKKSPLKSESVCSAVVTKTSGLEFDVAASSGSAFRGARKKCHRLKQERKAVNSILSSSRRSSDITSDPCPRHVLDDDRPSRRSSAGKQSDTTSCTRKSSCRLVSDEPIRSPGSVTVVYSRRRSTSDRPPSAVTFATDSQAGDQTQPTATDSCKRLAQQFLLTSILEYRLDAQRK